MEEKDKKRKLFPKKRGEMKYIVGVDIGTTSTKITAYNFSGKILEKLNADYELITPKDGFYEQSPDEIFDSFILELKKIISKCGKHDLSAVSFSSAMHSVIAVDKNGRALTNSILWSDSRSSSYVKKYKDEKNIHEIFLETGTPIHPMSPLFKIMWIKDNMEEIFKKTYKFISIKEYIFLKLFGKYYVDYSVASATGLFNIFEKKWNKRSLEFLEIKDTYFSEAVDITYQLFGMKKEYLEYLEIEKTVPFVIGASDGCLANLGAEDTDEGTAVMTLGTSGAIRVNSKDIKIDEDKRVFTYILDSEHYILGGAVNNAGIIIEWVRKNFDPGISYEKIFEILRETEIENEDMIFLPYLLGERAPIWNSDARGVFFGINLSHEKKHFIKAVLEGIVFSFYDVFQTLEEVKEIKRIYVNGGLSKSEIFIQLISDIFGREILVSENHESSCFGAFIVGLASIGEIENIEKFHAEKFEIKLFKPRKERHVKYEQKFLTYKRLYKNLKDIF